MTALIISLVVAAIYLVHTVDERMARRQARYASTELPRRHPWREGR